MTTGIYKKENLQLIYKILVILAHGMDYEFELSGGEGGSHTGFPGQKKVITIGQEQPLVNQVIILAHEIGHALDLIYNPIQVEELLFIMADWSSYSQSEAYYGREKDSWRRARQLLEGMKIFKLIKPRFTGIREACLGAYYSQMREKLFEGSKVRD